MHLIRGGSVLDLVFRRFRIEIQTMLKANSTQLPLQGLSRNDLLSESWCLMRRCLYLQSDSETASLNATICANTFS